MGGASRNEKRRRQDEADRRLAAAGINVPQKRSRTPMIVVAAIAVAVIVGLTVWIARGSGEVEPTYTATASGAVVTAGNGPVAVDIYGDYLCPNCERFEERYGDEITTALNEGRVTVRYHAVSILDTLTEPPGYSTRSANAAICAAEAGIFPRYHRALFDAQPAEGSAGLSDDELIALGTPLGPQGDFEACVRDGRHADAVAAETTKAAGDPALQTQGRFGTPTVAIDGQKVDLNNTGWLQDAIG